MTKSEKMNWMSNIENSAAAVAKEYGRKTVDFIFKKYNATNVCNLSPCVYSEVFSELYAIETDS